VLTNSARIWLLVAAVLLILGALYCAMWFVSSASLACVACNCEYSFSAPTFRCRQPPIALTLGSVLLAAAAVCSYLRWRVSRTAIAKLTNTRSNDDAP
jgi:HAMP domain-containing protein